MNQYFDNTIKMLHSALSSIDVDMFDKVIQECINCIHSGNKIVVSGLGKNVPICDKFVGSMLSLGLNASFLHTNSAIHGDMGMIKEGDLIIILSKSGFTEESIYLTERLLDRKNVRIWLITFNKCCVLADKIGHGNSIIIDLEHEGDMWNVMPNNSTTVYLIVLQTIAIRIAELENIQLDDFRINHPGGAIGARLKNG